MKRRGPKNKLQRGIRELLIGCVIGCAVGISFDLILFVWLILRLQKEDDERGRE